MHAIFAIGGTSACLPFLISFQMYLKGELSDANAGKTLLNIVVLQVMKFFAGNGKYVVRFLDTEKMDIIQTHLFSGFRHI